MSKKELTPFMKVLMRSFPNITEEDVRQIAKVSTGYLMGTIDHALKSVYFNFPSDIKDQIKKEPSTVDRIQVIAKFLNSTGMPTKERVLMSAQQDKLI